MRPLTARDGVMLRAATEATTVTMLSAECVANDLASDGVLGQ
jgi:hypothetical protein